MVRLLALSLVVPAFAAYEESSALQYAYLSTAAYCSYPHFANNEALTTWKCGPPCDSVKGMSDVFAINSGDDNDAFAFGGKLNGQCTLVFRGTSDLAGWLSDLKSINLVDLTEQGVKCSYEGTPCKVGDGFMKNYNSLQGKIVSNLKTIGCSKSSPLTVVGHSLGAAEAAIAMFDLKNQGYTISESYTYGQPRVGDSTFAKAFEAQFGSVEPFRITHNEDPVPHLPFEFMGFSHTTTEVYYSGDVSSGYKICKGGEDQSCSNSHSADVAAATLACASGGDKCDHLTYMATTKTILMDGTSCTNTSAVV